MVQDVNTRSGEQEIPDGSILLIVQAVNTRSGE